MMGDRIKRARKRLGMTQGTLGFEVGIGKSSISEWESGKRSPPIDKMQDIARTLKTSVAYLMGWVGDPDDMSHISRSEPLPFYSMKTGEPSGFSGVCTVDNARETLGQRAIDIMNLKGESAKSLEKKMNLTTDTLSKIIDGSVPISKEQTEQLAVILDVDVSTLLNRTTSIKFLNGRGKQADTGRGNYVWGESLLDSYSSAPVPTQQNVCKLLDCVYVKPVSDMRPLPTNGIKQAAGAPYSQAADIDGYTTLAAHGDGIPPEEMVAEVKDILSEVKKKYSR